MSLPVLPSPCTHSLITTFSSSTCIKPFPSIPWGNRRRGRGHLQLIPFPVILNALPSGSLLSSAALTALRVHRKPWQTPQPTLATLLPEMVRTTPTQSHPSYGHLFSLLWFLLLRQLFFCLTSPKCHTFPERLVFASLYFTHFSLGAHLPLALMWQLYGEDSYQPRNLLTLQS